MLWTFFGYLGVLIMIGLVARRQTSNLDDFVLADRKMGIWATSISYEVTAYSGWLMLGFPGRAVQYGFAAIWVGVACVIGDALNWVFISRRLREETQKLRALTVPEYLDRKFHRDGSHSIRIAASLALTIFMLIYLWSQVVGAGKAIEASIPDVNYFYATVLTTVVIMVYTYQGGYRAVVWVDMFQGVMIMMALVVMPIIAFVKMGGWHGLQDALARASVEATASGNAELAQQSGHLGALFAGLSGFVLFKFLFEDAGVGAGYIGQPHICTRFMSAEKPQHLRIAMVMSILFAMVLCAGAVSVGLVAHGWFRFASAQTLVPIASEQVADSGPFNIEVVLPRLVMEIYPGWLAGLVLSTIMADIISSAAGYLMAGASSAVEDIYYRLFRRQATQTELLRAGRLITLALALIAGVLAMTTDYKDEKSTVYNLVLYGWGGLAGAFSAPVFMAIYFRRMTRAGCLAGIIAGTSTCLLWHNIPDLAAVAYEVIPAMVISAAAIVIVSLFTQPNEQEIPPYPEVRT